MKFRDEIDTEAGSSHQFIQQMLENANLEIKELEKLTANVVRPNDPEMKFFQKHILKPPQFNNCNLYKFVQKTLMLNVGGLYQPLTFTFHGYLGKFEAYFSTKNPVPNHENGFEFRYENQHHL